MSAVFKMILRDFLFITLCAGLQSVFAQNERCTSKINCRDCIQQPSCAWCSKKNYQDNNNNDYHRCNVVASHAHCPVSDLTNPVYKETERVDQVLSAEKPENKAEKNPIQIRPQKLKLEARVGEVNVVKARFADAGNNPVDLYYLMDLSSSMETVKTQLAKVGKSIAEKMKETTSNFKLGFGSFVDKELLPFTDTSPRSLENPCINSQKTCVPTYSYKHGMTLDNNTDLFTDSVERANLSSNVDAPEGGFDALMQAMACDDVIGWRKEARKLLVFSTDAEFHVAGDGKLAGIVAPNDGICHMINDQYTHSKEMDYPSVAHIRSKAKEKSINIIFAISVEQSKGRNDKRFQLYESLKKVIPGSSVGILDENKIADFIKQEYDKIRQNLYLQYNNVPNGVSVTFSTACGSNDIRDKRTRHQCKDIQSRQIIDFDINIEITKWKNTENNTFQFSVFPSGFEIDKLDIEVEVKSSCACDQRNHPSYKTNAVECNRNGDLHCGICACKEEFTGRACECSKKEKDSNAKGLEEQCRNPDTLKICSDSGKCDCGQCKCYERDGIKLFSGTYCECDSLNCPRTLGGDVCGGPEKGTCFCGTCRCTQKYQGEACDCEKSDSACIPENGNTPCSGHGKCECGKCQCDDTDEGRYGGRYCDEQPTKQGQCESLKNCVRCVVFQEQPKEFLCDSCTDNITQVSKIKADPERLSMCSFYDEQDCRYTFAYDYAQNILAETTKECPEPVDFLAVVVGVIGGLVFIAIVTLFIWKIATTVHDKREFAAFQEELHRRKFEAGTSPLYVSPQTQYQNPAFIEGTKASSK